MIAPMKRAFVVLHEKGLEASLRNLRRLGVLHVEPLPGAGAEYDSWVAKRASVISAIGFLSEFKAKPAGKAFGLDEGLALAAEACGVAASAKAAADEQASIAREIERLRPWGDFDPEAFKALAGKGISLRLIEVEAKRLSGLPSELEYIKLDAGKAGIRLAAIGWPDGQLPVGCSELALPAKGLSALAADLEAAKARAAAARGRLAELAVHAKALGPIQARVELELRFESVRSGMPEDGGLRHFAAWVPTADVKRLSDAAAKEGWAVLLDEPLPEELPPTKVENNAAVRIIQPVFDFLGTVPNYREYDISGLFLAFFTVFFAMIFGDGGYGSLLLLVGIFAALKARKASGKVPDPIRLLLLLASATVAWGILTMSWFGLPAEILPGFLKTISIPAIASYNADSGQNVKLVCFALGSAHLLIARFMNLVRDRKSLKMLAQLGMLLQLAGMFFVVLNLVLDATKYPIPSYALYMILAGFILNFVFANYEGNLLKSILASLANIVSVFLGVVNVFADITSYIRLWAVGLAGVAISQTVNSMAGPMLGKALLFAAGLFLVGFGHGLNIVLSVLSVVVHGVRLNMLEFSGHLGMEWSGYAYDPFREAAQGPVPESERSIA